MDIWGNLRDGIEVASDNSLHGSSNITIQYNRIRTNTSTAQDGTGSGIHIGGSVTGTNVIQYNLITDNRDSGVWLVTGVGGSPQNVVIYGNTIWGNGAGLCCTGGNSPEAGISLALTTGVPVTIKNNLLGNNGQFEIVDSTNDAVSDYNDIFHAPGGNFMRCCFGTNTPFAGWKTSTGQDAHSLSTDPLVQSATNRDLRPTASSPINTAGVSLGAPYNIGLDPRTAFPFGTVAQQSSSNYTIGAFIYLPLP